MGWDALYVSPHPDDAVFSTGGALWKSAGRAAVVTVFSRAASARETELRRDEDRRALDQLGVARIDLELPEAPARDRAFERPARLFGKLQPNDGPIVNEVRTALASLGTTGETIVAPLGVGVHIDHQVVHDACVALGATQFYEDLPYGLCSALCEQRLGELGALARGDLFSTINTARWWANRPLAREVGPGARSPLGVPLTAAALSLSQRRRRAPLGRPLEEEQWNIHDAIDRKLEAIAAYRSQWPRFFSSLEAWRHALVARRGFQFAVERRWRAR